MSEKEKIDKGFLSKLAELFRSAFSQETALWKKNLLLLCIAQFIALLGMMAAVPFLPLYINELGVTDPKTARMWSGLVYAGPFMLSVIAVPLWGILGDKYGRKIMMLRAIFGLVIAVGLMGFVQNVEQLFTLRVVQGALSGFLAAALAYTTANTPENRIGFAIGMLQSSVAAGTILGPLFGGVISDITGIRPVFIIVAVLCFISGLLVLKYLKEPNKPNPESSKSQIGKSIAVVRENPHLLKLFFLVFLAQAGLHFTNPIFPYFVEELGAPREYLSTVVGVLFGIVGVFSIAFAKKWGNRNDIKDYRKTIRVASIVTGAGYAAHILIPYFAWLFPLRALIGVFYSAMIPTLYSALSKRTPTEQKGGVMGFASSATMLGNLSGYLLCGFIAAEFGLDWPFIISGSLLFGVAIFAGKRNNFYLNTELSLEMQKTYNDVN